MKIGFPVCKKENFAGLQAHRRPGKSARASPTPHHTLNEERSARFTAQNLSALAKTYHKAVYRSYTSQPSDPDAKYWLATFGMRRKQRDTAVLTFTIGFLSSPSISLFLPLFFLSLEIQQTSFRWETFLGKLLGYQDQRKKRQVSSGTRFSWKFSGQCYMVFCIVLRLVCFERPLLCTGQWTKLSLTIKTDDVTSGGRDVNPHQRLRVVQGQVQGRMG